MRIARGLQQQRYSYELRSVFRDCTWQGFSQHDKHSSLSLSLSWNTQYIRLRNKSGSKWRIPLYGPAVFIPLFLFCPSPSLFPFPVSLVFPFSLVLSFLVTRAQNISSHVTNFVTEWRSCLFYAYRASDKSKKCFVKRQESVVINEPKKEKERPSRSQRMEQ